MAFDINFFPTEPLTDEPRIQPEGQSFHVSRYSFSASLDPALNRLALRFSHFKSEFMRRGTYELHWCRNVVLWRRLDFSHLLRGQDGSKQVCTSFVLNRLSARLEFIRYELHPPQESISFSTSDYTARDKILSICASKQCFKIDTFLCSHPGRIAELLKMKRIQPGGSILSWLPYSSH